MGLVSAGTSPGREPRRPPLPAIVNGVGYALDPIGYIRWFARRYGTVTSPRFPGFGLIVSIADPELVRQVFTGDPATFHSGEASEPVLEPTVGANSVLTLDEEPHMRQRKLLLEPFHGENVRRWEDTIRAITEQDIASWPVGRPFALHDHTRAITLEVILRAVFGVREQARFERARALVTEFANRAHPITHVPVRPARSRPAQPVGAVQAGAGRRSTPSSTRRSSAAAPSPTWPSATTSSRCCSAPPTRPASR